MEIMKARLKKFNLEISPDKTAIIRFGKQPWCDWKRRKGKKPGVFNFLGFTHFCGSSKHGNFIMGHKTSKISFQSKLQVIKKMD